MTWPLYCFQVIRHSQVIRQRSGGNHQHGLHPLPESHENEGVVGSQSRTRLLSLQRLANRAPGRLFSSVLVSSADWCAIYIKLCLRRRRVR